MAFNDLPTQLFPGMSEDGTDITLPLAAIPQVTAAEADAASGSLRKLWFGMCDRVKTWWYALDAADRPTKMTVSTSSSTNEATGQVTKTYVFQFVTEVSGEEVVDES